METQINFFSEDIDFEITNSDSKASWIENTIEESDHQLGFINYIFCSDEYLHKINVEHLNHDTYTDIITFQYNEQEEPVESDIYISVERIEENAKEFNTSFDNELDRVIIHGVLHLMGQGDKTEEEKQQMREREDYFLSLRGK